MATAPKLTTPTLATPQRADSHKWLVALAVMLGATLEVLDTSIVNVALPHMQGSFSASVDEITWVLTSYLVANGIMIPLTGWISSRSEEHTSELQSRPHLVCRLLLQK